jgi:uncharacterized RDD family membrane protein YckC
MTSESRRAEARAKLRAAIAPIPAAPAKPEEYIGLITRIIAFTIDLLVINVFAILTAGALSLFFSVFSIPTNAKTIIAGLGAVSYFLWVVGYFTIFWSTTGQTPGDRVLRIKVVSSIDAPIKPRRAVLRLGALVLGAIPIFAGYVIILFDDKRRAFHDHVARTTVIDATDARTPGFLANAHRPGSFAARRHEAEADAESAIEARAALAEADAPEG